MYQPNYDIKVYIDNKDFTDKLFKVEVVSSVNFIFSMFLLSLKIEALEVFSEELFGQKEVNLNIYLTSEDREPKECLQIALIILKSKFSVTPSEMMSSSDKDPSSQPRTIHLYCIPKFAFEKMYSTVNILIENNSLIKIGKEYKSPTPLNTVRLITERLGQVNTDISSQNENTDTIFQMLIPPTNFISSITLVNNKYSLYKKGTKLFVSFRFKEDSTQVLSIWDLKWKMLEKEDYELILLSPGLSLQKSDEINTTPYWTQRNKLNRYFVFTSIKTVYSGNQKIIKGSYDNIFVSHPETELYQTNSISMDDIFKENSLTEDTSEFQLNDSLKGLKKVFLGNVPESAQRSYLSSQIMDLSEISLTINSGNLPFINLMKVGGKIILENYKPNEYSMYTGSYIVKKSYLIWNRYTTTPNYQCNAKINCIRGFYR